jgi:sugar phosphate isomerase/epimerase
MNRRHFLQASTASGAALTASALAVNTRASATPPSARRSRTEAEKLARIAINTWPLRQMFPRRGPNQQPTPMQQKYGAITMLDLPQYTRDQFPGIFHMDLWSSLFGDVTDASMFESFSMDWEGQQRQVTEFNPAAPSSRRWLDQLANKSAALGMRVHHFSNNAPRNIADPDDRLRGEGIAVAKKWLDAAATLGAKTMRVNSGGPRIVPGAIAQPGSYPKNNQIEIYLKHAIDSFKEMADYGGKVGVKVTLENHWGLTADPTNIRIIIEEVNSPWCEASPDFCNWEHEYMLFHGLSAVADLAHTTVHAKYWDRWTKNDVQRSTRIMEEAGFQGIYALEYEDGPWDGVEGARYLLKEVLAAL